MRGKNYTAAEKHFIGKQDTYEKEIKRLKALVSALNDKNKDTLLDVERLNQENCKLKRQIDTLLANTGISKEELEALCEANINAEIVLKLLVRFTGV